jgi:hypothetical protein
MVVAVVGQVLSERLAFLVVAEMVVQGQHRQFLDHQ